MLMLVVDGDRMQIDARDRRDGFSAKVPLTRRALAALIREGSKLVSAVDLLGELAREE